MSSSHSSSHKSTITNGHAHYKITRTVTGADGKTHTETVEMAGDDAINVSSMNCHSWSKNVFTFHLNIS